MRTSAVRLSQLTVALLLSGGSASVVHAQPSQPEVLIVDDWYGPDKALHFGSGVLLAGGGYGLTATQTDCRWLRAGVGLGIAIAAAAAKEGLDAAGLGQPSYKDFTWSVTGGVLGVGLGLGFDFAIGGF